MDASSLVASGAFSSAPAISGLASVFAKCASYAVASVAAATLVPLPVPV